LAAFSGQGVVRAIVIRPRDWTKLDSLQVLTKWLNGTPKRSLCNWIVE